MDKTSSDDVEYIATEQLVIGQESNNSKEPEFQANQGQGRSEHTNYGLGFTVPQRQLQPQQGIDFHHLKAAWDREIKASTCTQQSDRGQPGHTLRATASPWYPTQQQADEGIQVIDYPFISPAVWDLSHCLELDDIQSELVSRLLPYGLCGAAISNILGSTASAMAQLISEGVDHETILSQWIALAKGERGSGDQANPETYASDGEDSKDGSWATVSSDSSEAPRGMYYNGRYTSDGDLESDGGFDEWSPGDSDSEGSYDEDVCFPDNYQGLLKWTQADRVRAHRLFVTYWNRVQTYMYNNLPRHEATILAWEELSAKFDDNWEGLAYPPGSRSMEILRKKELGSSLICDLYRHIPSADEPRPIAVAEELRRVQFRAIPTVYGYDPIEAVGVRSASQCEKRMFPKPDGVHTQRSRASRPTLTGATTVSGRPVSTEHIETPAHQLDNTDDVQSTTDGTTEERQSTRPQSHNGKQATIHNGRTVITDGTITTATTPNGRTVKADGTITKELRGRKRKGRRVDLARAFWSMLAHVYALLHFTFLITCYVIEEWCMELVTNTA